MSVSGELLCSFELLKPLDSSALKSHIKKGRNKRNSILNSPVSFCSLLTNQNVCRSLFLTTASYSGNAACSRVGTKLLKSSTSESLIFHWRKIRNNEGAVGVRRCFFVSYDLWPTKHIISKGGTGVWGERIEAFFMFLFCCLVAFDLGELDWFE